VNKFVEECRREWRRLGVADPIANEMAADLRADIEEAESEGGSAEDVLGNSAFDPRRFAESWAIARGVTALPVSASPRRRWPAVAFGLVGCAALLALGGAFLVGGRQSAAAISSVSRNLARPRSVHVFPGSPIVLQHFQHFPGLAIFGLLLLAVGVVSVGLAVLYLAPWNGSRIGPWEIRRYRPHSEVPRDD
jgi:hypothetical protein